jgi:RNA polymerase sigma-70 factor (ECF subfamily)
VTGQRHPDAEAPAVTDRDAERALVDRARAGDRMAMGALYDLYVEKIYRYVLVRVNGNQSDAEDITAEIFVRMIDALPRFQWQDVPFLAWLFRIAHNQVISHHRRASARPVKAPIEDMDFADPKHGTDWLVEQKLLLEDVYNAAKKLPEAQRRVIELRFGAQLSVRETAQILGKSENNVKVLQFKAIARLQKLLAQG